MEGKRHKVNTEDITRKGKISDEAIHESEEALEEIYQDEVEEAYSTSDRSYPPRPHRPFLRDVSFLGVLFQIVVVSVVIGIIAGIVFYAPHFLTSGISIPDKNEVAVEESTLDDSLISTSTTATSTQTATTTSTTPVALVKKLRILETETGWLNVRATPSASGTRVTRVSPRSEYVYKELKDGWYLITIDAKMEGWVLGEYVELIK